LRGKYQVRLTVSAVGKQVTIHDIKVTIARRLDANPKRIALSKLYVGFDPFWYPITLVPVTSRKRSLAAGRSAGSRIEFPDGYTYLQLSSSRLFGSCSGAPVCGPVLRGSWFSRPVLNEVVCNDCSVVFLFVLRRDGHCLFLSGDWYDDDEKEYEILQGGSP
jgi:hypothetical protein